MLLLLSIVMKQLHLSKFYKVQFIRSDKEIPCELVNTDDLPFH